MAKKNLGAGYKLKKIQMHQDDVKKDDRDGLKIGVANGLNLTHFLNELFYLNYDEELTDEDLDAAMRKEFPVRENFQNISAYRSYYNSAKHGHGQGEPLEGEYKLKAFKPEKPEPPKKVTKKEEAAKGKTPPKAKAGSKK
jgi:hypothetical protein